jgi:hypothetical protein
MDSGLPSRPRSELERSAVQAALRASLDFYTAVHGYAATQAVVDHVLPEPEPPTPPPPRPVAYRLPELVVDKAPRVLRGPAWADIDSEDD